MPPGVNVPLDKVTLISSAIEGLQRQTAFDSAGTRSNRRLVPRRVRPEIQLPVWRATEGTACWVHGGWVCINRINAHANSFIVIEPGAQDHIESAFGALLLMCVDGREQSPTAQQNDSTSLFGFRRWLRLRPVSPSAANRLAISRSKVLPDCVCSALLAAETSRALRSCWPCTNDAPEDCLMLTRPAVRSHTGLPEISPPSPQANAGGTTVDILQLAL